MTGAAPIDAGTGQLTAIRGVLDGDLGERASEAFASERELVLQAALDQIEQIVGSSRTASGIEPGGSAHITPADLQLVRGALYDAATLLIHGAIQWCNACHTGPADWCPEHADNLGRADAYRALLAMLGRPA